MRFSSAVLAATSIVLSGAGAGATPAQMTTPIIRLHESPYAAVASCLAAAMAGADATAWRMVYPPPRTEAFIMLWPKGTMDDGPLGVFHVQQDIAGTVHVHYEGDNDGQIDRVAHAAVTRCALRSQLR